MYLVPIYLLTSLNNKAKYRLFNQQVASKMLKGNDKQRQKSWKEHDMIDDTETRYLSVQARLVSHDVLEILTACSDGVIRLWNWKVNSKIVDLVNQTEVMDNAILKIAWHDQDGFLAADTLGNITYWSDDLNRLWKMCDLHENGINSFSIDSKKGFVYTGGDDGTITVSNLKSQKIIRKNRQISAAHITGLHIDCDQDETNLISVSVDQRITRWKIDKENSSTGSIIAVNQLFSSVPDIHDMVVWRNRKNKIQIAVVGNGIEMLYF